MRQLVTNREKFEKFNENYESVKISQSEYKKLLGEVVKNHEADVEEEPNSYIPFTEDEMFIVEQYLVNPRMVATEAMRLMKEFIG